MRSLGFRAHESHRAATLARAPQFRVRTSRHAKKPHPPRTAHTTPKTRPTTPPKKDEKKLQNPLTNPSRLEYTYISDISEMSDGAWYHFQSQWELSRKNGWVSEAVDALVLAEKKRREDDEDEDEE